MTDTDEGVATRRARLRRDPAAPPQPGHMRRHEAMAGYLFLAPNLIGFAVFSLIPIAIAFALTFTSWDLVHPPQFQGLGNYETAMKDPLFWQTARNTLYYTFGAVPIAVFIAFWLALLLNRAIRGITIFRTIIFLPYVTLTVAIAVVWIWIYNPDIGLLNYLLGLVGIEGPQWLQDTAWAMPAVIVMSNWQGIGYPMLIFLAALQTIPKEYLDAAHVDGASWLQRIRHVILPMVSPATFFVLVTSFIGAMQGFDQFYVMTQGGPAYSTTTIVYYIYQNAFGWLRLGYAGTLAFILFVAIMIITLVQWRLGRRWVYSTVSG
jgi:multiple sugar transport system permease protein